MASQRNGDGSGTAAGAWNASVARTDITSSAVFSSDRQGAGVWAGGGVTRTKPSPTLFIAGIPRGSSRAEVEALFRKEVGFNAARTVGRMLFIDFASTTYALQAMRAYQGKPIGEGHLVIDFDKDVDAAARAKRRKTQMEAEEVTRLANSLTLYHCMICKDTRVFALAPIDNTHFMDMPKRSTGDTVVDEAKFLRHCDLVPSGPEPKLIRREGGLERRWELLCPKCKLPVAYRSTPPAVAGAPAAAPPPGSYLYVLPDAVCWSQAARVPAARWASEARGEPQTQTSTGNTGASGASGPGRGNGRSGKPGAGQRDNAEGEEEEGDDYGWTDPTLALGTSSGSNSSAKADAGVGTDSAGGERSAASASSGDAVAAAPVASSAPSGVDFSGWPAALRARALAALAAKASAAAAAALAASFTSAQAPVGSVSTGGTSAEAAGDNGPAQLQEPAAKRQRVEGGVDGAAAASAPRPASI